VNKKAAKRTKAAKELPLVSPHWWAREKTVAYCRAHRGEIADVALTAAVNAGELPVKLEWIDHETDPPVQRRLLLSAKDYEFGPYISSNFLVVQPRRSDVPPLPRPHALFFWGPRAKELSPTEKAEPASTEQQAADPLEPPLHRRGPVLTHDWFSICGEIARRCIDSRTGRVRVPVKGSSFVRDMREWCRKQGWAEPARSEMSEAVRRIGAALKDAEK
jgi:hypothetical protein